MEKKVFSKIHPGYQKTQIFMPISKMLTRRQNKLPKKGYRQKKCQKSLKLFA